ncbi:hypothetical protein HCN44_008003 [Aphidius gifuensis]|uniref:VPS9 domain-containing protein n=1 Tax=Aphidius gifuensis TaxID=684658 RepID=A0A835CNA7_APHGI|nr:ankyrin repeat domain-containing protein 27-like [Aphidius gifuensis]KAF7989329.1 hypothetical protein HCN44_008003 [Aphidius gifuensis]
MNANYDENLLDNYYLQSLCRDYTELFNTAVEKSCIICIPRRDSWITELIDENNIKCHILILDNFDDKSCYYLTLDGHNVQLKNGLLTIDIYNEKNTVKLLFEEIFYNNKNKYTVWCIERPLVNDNMYLENDLPPTVKTLSDCEKFIFSQLNNKKIFNELNNHINSFIIKNNKIENLNSTIQCKLIKNLYKECLNKILNDVNINKKSNDNLHYQHVIKISIECHVLYELRNQLKNIISINTSDNDSHLNKIIKNIQDLELDDLNIENNAQINDKIHRSKIELSRINSFITILGKIGCLKRAINYISKDNNKFNNDSLLPILIFIIIKTGLTNWNFQLEILKHYNFSNDHDNNSETSFLITTLEASIEYIKTKLSIINNNKFLKLQTSLTDKLFTNTKNNNNNRNLLFNYEKLCHPLCRCEKCKINYSSVINIKDEKGRTPLHIACYCGDIKLINYLIVNNALINEPDNNCQTPIHYATMRGHQNVLLLLLLHDGCNINIVDNSGFNLLHFAAYYCHDVCLKTILCYDKNININSQNNAGDTALHIASKLGYKAIVNTLVECGADRDIKNKRGQTPLTIAHNKIIIKIINSNNNTVDKINLNCKLIKGNCKKLNNEIKPKIVDNKIDKLMRSINDGDVRLACYYLGLEGACTRPRKTSVDLILCHPLCRCNNCHDIDETIFDDDSVGGPDKSTLNLNVTNLRGETCLHLACLNGLDDLIEILIDAGADVNAMTIIEKRTALHIACYHGKIKIVKLLLNCQTININSADYLGDTALHIAAKNGFIKIVELILRHDVDIYLRNCNGLTAMEQVHDIIREYKFSSQTFIDILNILKNH